MNNLDVTVYGPNHTWSFTVTEDRYDEFMDGLRKGRFVSLAKSAYTGEVTKTCFNPAQVVAVSAIPSSY